MFCTHLSHFRYAVQFPPIRDFQIDAHGKLMERLIQLIRFNDQWYDNPDVSVQYGTITRMSVLQDYVQLGEEARFPSF